MPLVADTKFILSTTANDPWLATLRQAVRVADRQLTDATYRATMRLFAEAQHDPTVSQALGKEYGREEVLLCVDRTGAPVAVSEAVLLDFRRVVIATPGFTLWFREATLPDGRPTLLVARWLCHVAGFRHRIAALFLDHPTLPDHTVLQVRGLGKAEAPGLFDLPAAGHVSGLDSVEETLRREIHEELGVSLDAVVEVTTLGSYDYADAGGANAEYCTIYRGRLSEADWLRLGASSEELLAIATMPVPKLRALVATHPERIASGLSASLTLYNR